jgi:hypothetical protein
VLIVPERLNALPAAVHPSRTRASARNADLRSNSDNHRDDACPKIQNVSAFGHGTGVRATRTVALRTCTTLQAICRPLKSHS